jgi:hypothetical protein
MMRLAKAQIAFAASNDGLRLYFNMAFSTG